MRQRAGPNVPLSHDSEPTTPSILQVTTPFEISAPALAASSVNSLHTFEHKPRRDSPLAFPSSPEQAGLSGLPIENVSHPDPYDACFLSIIEEDLNNDFLCDDSVFPHIRKSVRILMKLVKVVFVSGEMPEQHGKPGLIY